MPDAAQALQIINRVRTACETLRRLRGNPDPFVVEHLRRVDDLLEMNLELLESAVRYPSA